MKARQFVLIVALLAAEVIAGCEASAPPDRPDTATYGPDVIHLEGLRNIEFGDTAQDLIRRGALHPQETGCGPHLAGLSTASPVFADDRLVLLWVSPPVHTPEGVTAGTTVKQVRATYPAATRLTAPPGTYRLDGLLATQGDRAYLFLHDGQTVRKTIAGYADYAQRLFDEGFGTC